MKIETSREWFRSRAPMEEGQEIGAGVLADVARYAAILIDRDRLNEVARNIRDRDRLDEVWPHNAPEPSSPLNQTTQNND